MKSNLNFSIVEIYIQHHIFSYIFQILVYNFKSRIYTNLCEEIIRISYASKSRE